MNVVDKVTNKLISDNLTISFMESCTAGLLASCLTDVCGASSIFSGSLVTYSNNCKIEAGVDKKVINQFGVYSSETARAMAETIKDKFHTDIAIGITGTTGNVDLNNSDSEKGKAYFCIIFNSEVFDYNIEISTDDMSRREIKEYYAMKVYEELYTLIK